MERGNYQLEQKPVYTEEIARVIDDDDVVAESGPFYNLIFRILNNIKAIFQKTERVEDRLEEVADISSHFILSIDFAGSFAGKTYTVTGGELNHTGNVPDCLHVLVEAPAGDATYTVSCDGNTVEVPVGQYYGVFSATLDAFPDNIEDFTWGQIGLLITRGESEVRKYFSVGDEKTIRLATGEELTLQIYGLYHDDLADGSGKAPITWGLKNLMAETRQMETSNINTNGFTGSAMYAWMTGTLLPSLPAELRSLIRPVTKKTSAGNQSTTILSEAMSIFLFSEVECFGSTSYSVAGEGSQYPVFTDNTSRVKYLANGTGAANTWWERSPRSAMISNFCIVTSSGAPANNGTASSSFGVCFGFCIDGSATADMDRAIETHDTDTQSHQDIRAALANKANLDDVDFSGLEAAISEAQTTANVAKTTADTAKSTAETAKSTAETAQSTAGTAKTTADTAKSTADTAKSTADTAKTNADTAKSTATAAQTTANAAMPKGGGTFTGQVYAADSADTAKRVRNIQISTTDLTAGSSNLANGLIYLVYE